LSTLADVIEGVAASLAALGGEEFAKTKWIVCIVTFELNGLCARCMGAIRASESFVGFDDA
jgi:hypothetical protein